MHGNNPYTNTAAPALPMNEQTLSEQFSEEAILDIDNTLVDAVDRVLAQSGNTSRVVSNTSSRSSSRQGRREERAQEDSFTTEVPRGECKQTILGALEQVVKSIAADNAAQAQARLRAHREGQAHAADGAASGAGAERHLRHESTLREGVRKWMNEVERAR